MGFFSDHQICALRAGVYGHGVPEWGARRLVADPGGSGGVPPLGYIGDEEPDAGPY